AALGEPVEARHHVQPIELNAPYIAEMARAEMVGRYGSDAYTEGLRVTTTGPAALQEAASQAVGGGLSAYGQRQRFRGPEPRRRGLTREAWQAELAKYKSIGGLQPAIVTQVEKSGIMVLLRNGEEQPVAWDSMKWARPFFNTNSLGPRPQKPADVAQIGDPARVERDGENDTLLCRQIPAAQRALVPLHPQKREPVATLSWLLGLALLPYVGFLVYHVFGPQRIRRQRLRRAKVRGELPTQDLVDNEEVAELARMAHEVTGLPMTTATDVRL